MLGVETHFHADNNSFKCINIQQDYQYFDFNYLPSLERQEITYTTARLPAV